MLNIATDPIADSSISVAERTLYWAAAAFLFVMPFTSSVALRNIALGIAFIAAIPLVANQRVKFPRLPNAILVTGIGWIVVCAMSWFWSIDRPYTANEFVPEVLTPLIAFGVFWLGARREALRVWIIVLLSGVALLGTLAIGEMAFTGTWNPNRWHGGVGAYSTWLVMVFPFVMEFSRPRTALPFNPGNMRWPLFAFFLFLITSSAYLTLNRFVWPALAVVLSAFCALCLSDSWMMVRDRRRLLAVGALLLIGLTIAFAFVATNRAPAEVSEVSSVQETLQEDPRAKLWSYAIDSVMDAPIAGHGFGRGILRSDLQSTFGTRMLWHGHNVLLNVLLQTGVLGLTLFIALLSAFALRYVAYWRAGTNELNAVGVIGLAFLAGALVKNMTDDFLVRHTGLLFWSTNAMLIGYGERLIQRTHKS